MSKIPGKSPAKSPKNPLLYPVTTKVSSSKMNKVKSTASGKLRAGPSTPSTPHIPAVRPAASSGIRPTPTKEEREKKLMLDSLTPKKIPIQNSQGKETPRSAKALPQKQLSSTSSVLASPKVESPEGLKKQIRDQTQFNLQQSLDQFLIIFHINF